ncbi:uncharacterized protein LOC130170890 [Seriola aureovittata]|uniref:uncharacterized protein LOC130170890 n=1 Tax=Seriola aureovittata TaxID=2871759 RepID=UPI0024BDE20A|nr:uncharacterized protein LOC130170890 [Seriola aureovittata]
MTVIEAYIVMWEGFTARLVYQQHRESSLSSCRAFSALMDRRRMDAEGGRVVHREWRARKLAVVVAVQNVLVAACLFITLYVYWGVQDQERASGDNVHIQFDAIATISGNATLQFKHTKSMNMMSVAGEKKDKIYVNCTGPYVLYIHLCYTSLGGEKTTGMLQLQVVRDKTPVSSFTLQTSEEVCEGLNSIAYLKAKDQASLHLYAKEEFKILEVSVGLTYLLGRQCDF